jgi:hypothetical protein
MANLTRELARLREHNAMLLDACEAALHNWTHLCDPSDIVRAYDEMTETVRKLEIAVATAKAGES